jgi:hypothetical protein
MELAYEESIGLGMEALLSLILRVPADIGGPIEKCFIRAVAMAACVAPESQLPDQICIDFIKRTIQSMEARRLKSLSREAAHAALIVRYLYLRMIIILLISTPAHLETSRQCLLSGSILHCREMVPPCVGCQNL